MYSKQFQVNRSIEQLQYDFSECIQKDQCPLNNLQKYLRRSQDLRSVSNLLQQRSQDLRSVSNEIRQRGQNLKSISNKCLERSHQLNNFASGTSEQLHSDLDRSFRMTGQLQSDLDQRLETIEQAQSDVAQSLQKIQQLRSKVDKSLQKVSRLIKNRQLDVSASNTFEESDEEAAQKIVLEEVYRLINQIKTGTWSEDEETTASDSL